VIVLDVAVGRRDRDAVYRCRDEAMEPDGARRACRGWWLRCCITGTGRDRQDDAGR